ncbi:MAG: DUF4231 domain-containing protein [Candidatus Koribacter versatilis]|uniref:DUF4231 domain-containing protein n=1 Tax=Candidatus Korobacter versatilis TaxID=658062 RepID=A0A932A833_9BACT|nr:DUF4231 domain-containing protein [Candidatus Koribacter versatilis]
MEASDYPWLHRAANTASDKTQRKHFSLLGIQLGIFLLVGVLVAVPTWVLISAQTANFLAEVAGVFLAAGLLIAAVTRQKKYEQAWFECRAVAESAKKLAWRYMMLLDPFTADCVDADNRFLDGLEAVRTERDIAGELAGQEVDRTQLSERMKTVRSRSFDERKVFYLVYRVADQREWYERRAKSNGRRAEWFFAGVLFIQFVALTNLLFKGSGFVQFSAAGVLMTLAASFSAWAQARRYEELSTAYSVAAEELTHLENLIALAETETELSSRIASTEEAISREHTSWKARRRVR